MKYNKLIILLFISVALYSCEDYVNSAVESRITYLAKMEVHGEPDITLDCNATGYTDAGATATLQGVEIPVTTTITGNYFGGSTVDGSDAYEIAYSAYNEDDIPAPGFRYVLWPECNGDLVNSIAGMYTVDVARNGSISADYIGNGPFFIVDLGGGKYQLSDAIGGYYDFGRGYGYHYAATGIVITANDISSNDFTFDNTTEVGGFGGEVTMTSFTVDADTKTIVFTSEWEFGYDFEVTLTLAE